MSQKLNIRAFFFNAKTDYLPYYKNFTLTLADDAVAKDMLIAIKEQNENFSFPELNLVFKVNGLITDEDTTVADIIEKLGTELTIDPANSYRANNGLIINNDDFMKSFELLAPYATEADKAYYKTLYALHYASETENFDRDYIGDAILVLAHKMITEGNEHKTEILNAISSVNSGLLECEYENNLFDAQDHTESINALKEILKSDDNEHPSLFDMFKARFCKKDESSASKKEVKRASVEIDDLTDKYVAYYAGTSDNTTVNDMLDQTGITTVSFGRSHKLSGLEIVEDNKKLAFHKAGATLLDAFDSGAGVVVVEDNATYDMMSKNFSAIENTIGRKMIGLELITSEDFIAQLEK